MSTWKSSPQASGFEVRENKTNEEQDSKIWLIYGNASKATSMNFIANRCSRSSDQMVNVKLTNLSKFPMHAYTVKKMRSQNYNIRLNWKEEFWKLRRLIYLLHSISSGCEVGKKNDWRIDILKKMSFSKYLAESTRMILITKQGFHAVQIKWWISNLKLYQRTAEHYPEFGLDDLTGYEISTRDWIWNLQPRMEGDLMDVSSEVEYSSRSFRPGS